jgi:hypothetical protein
VWKLRCDQEHGKTMEDTRQRALHRLTPQVTHLFNQQNQIDQPDAHLFSKPLDEILRAPTAIIENWVFKTSIRVKDSIKRRRQKEKNTNLPIHPFFNRHSPITHKVRTKSHRSKERQLRPTIITQFFHSNSHSSAAHKNDLRPP